MIVIFLAEFTRAVGTPQRLRQPIAGWTRDAGFRLPATTAGEPYALCSLRADKLSAHRRAACGGRPCVHVGSTCSLSSSGSTDTFLRVSLGFEELLLGEVECLVSPLYMRLHAPSRIGISPTCEDFESAMTMRLCHVASLPRLHSPAPRASPLTYPARAQEIPEPQTLATLRANRTTRRKPVISRTLADVHARSPSSQMA